MKSSRFTETPILAILKEADAGVPVKEVCRKHGMSDATYYNWKSKCGGMEASDLKRLKEMEREMSHLPADVCYGLSGLCLSEGMSNLLFCESTLSHGGPPLLSGSRL